MRMKWLIWWLLLGNVVLFAYFSFSMNASQPAGIPLGQQPMQPEKLNILTPAQLEALPKRPLAAESAPVQTACYEWGSFSAADFARARAALEKYSVDASARQTNAQEARRYWVYIPPRKNFQEALAKNDELHALGIQDTFVVQEPQWRYAISFGIFKDETLASKLLQDLRARGVSLAVKGVRNQEKGQSGLFLKNVPADTVDEIGKLRPDFPGSELKQVECQ